MSASCSHHVGVTRRAGARIAIVVVGCLLGLMALHAGQALAAAPPTLSIATPVGGLTYARGHEVDSSFTCTAGTGDTGIASCVDQNGNPSGSAIDTSSIGSHTLTVTATGNDGLTRTASVTYWVAARPGVWIAAPVDGATYAQGQVIDSSFGCWDGNGGTGIATCVDQHGRASGAPIGTTRVGWHTLTITATSDDGLARSESVSYYVAAPPTVSIATPVDGTTYAQGQVLDSSFVCTDGDGGTGIATCADQNDDLSGTAIDTSSTGSHTLTVTATSDDGLTGTASVTYTVAAAPTASITTPGNGVIYAQGQVIDSSFLCTDGAGGTGIATCVDQNGHPSGAAIDTSSTGSHTLTVTATSNDGQTGTASITYIVAAPTPPPAAATAGSPATSGEHRRPPTPELGGLRLTPRAFHAATLSATIARATHTGTTIRYHDTLAAKTTLTVLRCSGRHERCTRLVMIGSFTHRDHAGTNRLRFTGRLFGHRLRPGRYTLRLTATLAGQTSRRRSITFRILAPPRT